MKIAVGWMVVALISLTSAEVIAGPACPAGKLTTAGGACCWPGQISVGSACAGAPQCPTGTLSAGAECVVTPALVVVARDTAARGAAAPSAPATSGEDEAAQARAMDRARFSGKRLLAEMGVGAASGLVISLLLCNSSLCPSDGWLAFFVDLGATPIAIWALGGSMGGRGSLLDTYLGASAAVAPLGLPPAANETPEQTLSRIQTEVTVSALALPICSAVLYEVSSHFASVRWHNEHTPKLTVRPLFDHDRMAGGVGTLALRF